jgi:hypothetical protein
MKSSVVHSLTYLCVTAVVSCGLLGASGRVALADPIAPGFDLFETPAGASQVDLTSFGIGIVPLQGYRPPVSALFAPPYNSPSLNDTDTIVQRLAGISPLPVGGSGNVPIQLVALSLQSVAPVNISGNFYDLKVLGGSLLTPSDPSPVGNMTVNHTLANGGTFSSILPVHATLTFTQVGNPSNTFSQPFADTFTGNGVWSHTPREDDVHFPPFPSGGMYPGVDPNTGQKVLTSEQAQLAAHGVLPAQLASDVVRVVDAQGTRDYPVDETANEPFLGPPQMIESFNAPNQWILFKEPPQFGGGDSDRLSIRGGHLYFESDPLGPLFGDLPPNPVAIITENGTFQRADQFFQGAIGPNPQIFVFSDLNVPEPGSVLLLVISGVALAFAKRVRQA